MIRRAVGVLAVFFILIAASASAAESQKPKITAKDTNGDGKPDQFKQFLKGRSLVLHEYDRNFDGKIDMRKLSEWAMIRPVPGESPLPGYRTVRREEDNDFDGIVDVYYDRNDKDSRLRVGKKI